MSMTATADRGAPVKPNPQVLGGVAPYLNVDGAAKASELYVKAFGAEVVNFYPVDGKGRTMHVHLYINGGSVMLSDPFPEHGCLAQAPQGFSLLLHVDDVDMWWTRAVNAGLEIVMPLEKQFWGDRYGQLRDPFGIVWALAAPAE